MPPNAQSGVSRLTCNFTTNSDYCVGRPLGYCEATRGGATSCFVSSLGPAPPPSPNPKPPRPPSPPPAPPLPAPPAPPHCETAVPFVGSRGTYVTGAYCAPGRCGPKCVDAYGNNFCVHGGIICRDGSINALWGGARSSDALANWTAPPGTTNGATLSCAITFNGNSPCTYTANNNSNNGYCAAFAIVGAPNPRPGGSLGSGSCSLVSPQAAPAPPPPQCATIDLSPFTLADTVVTGRYCPDSRSCPATCTPPPPSFVSKCRNGGLVCADSTVYAHYWPWTVPCGAKPGDLITCTIRPNKGTLGYCNATSSYCEPARGSTLDCFRTAGDACPHSNVHPQTNGGAVAGAVIGALAAVAAVIGGGVVAFRYLKRREIQRRAWTGGLAELGANESDYAELNGGGGFPAGSFQGGGGGGMSAYVPPSGAGGGEGKGKGYTGEWQQHEVPLN